MTCTLPANPDRSQLFALSVCEAGLSDTQSAASTDTSSAESMPTLPNAGGLITAARVRAYSQAIQHRPGTSKRAFYEGQAQALTHLALSLRGEA